MDINELLDNIENSKGNPAAIQDIVDQARAELSSESDEDAEDPSDDTQA